MKIGLLGLISSDLTDVDYNKVRIARDLGFDGAGAHLNVPASAVSEEVAKNAKAVFDDQGMSFVQLAGPYPCIITPDESIRQAGVKGAQDIAKLAAKMGVSASLVRPTSLNPRGAWNPHPGNYLPEAEDRLVQSLIEILQVAEDVGVEIVLETGITTTLDTPETIKRVIERTGSNRLKVNIDPVNFMSDLKTAYYPTDTINHMFDVLGPYVHTVHVKDFYLEDRLWVHISETVIGTGIMDLDTVLLRSSEVLGDDKFAVIEHLPMSMIPLAKRNLDEKLQELGLH